MKLITAWVFLIALLGVFAIPQPALAYLDPVSGSMILQLLVGGVAGVVVLAKMYWQRFMNLFYVGRGELHKNHVSSEDKE